MNVMLPPHLESLIREKVESGYYNDAIEVVEEALRLLQEHDQAKMERLRAALDVGRDEIARGEVVEWTPDFMERLKAEADEEDRLGLPISNDVQP